MADLTASHAHGSRPHPEYSPDWVEDECLRVLFDFWCVHDTDYENDGCRAVVIGAT